MLDSDKYLLELEENTKSFLNSKDIFQHVFKHDKMKHDI